MRKWLVLLSLAVIAVAAVLTVRLGQPAPRLLLDSGYVIEPPRSLARFELIDQWGRALDNDRLKGRWNLVMIGFTHCPDVCPTGLHQLAVLKQRLAGHEVELGVLFVSVDPERDTPEVLDQYTGFFGEGLVGATGQPEQLRRFGDSLDFAWVRVPLGDGHYTVDHSSAVALIDPEARLAGYFPPPFDLESIEADLVRVVGTAD